MVKGMKDGARKGRRVPAGCDTRSEGARGISVLVPRNRLMHQLEAACEGAGTVFACAPLGFGKTAALLELVMRARKEPDPIAARIIDARGLTASELVQQLQGAAEELGDAERALVAVDNVPAYGKERCAQVAGELRALRAAGVRAVLACTPDADALMRSMGDAAKLGAQAFKVQAREYADWARALALSSQMDMYGLTQGVPAFVAALRGESELPAESAPLDREVAAVYREAVLGSARTCGRRLMKAMFLARHGTFDQLEKGGVQVREAEVRRVASAYPLFGLDAGGGAFSCVRMRGSTYEQLARLVAARDPALATRVARALMAAGRTDDALWMAVSVLTRAEAGQLIAHFPLQACLDGHGCDVRAVYDDLAAARRTGPVPRPGASAEPLDLGMVLAAYVASLMSGDRRVARALAFELAARADEVARSVTSDDWDAACACADLWGGAGELALPRVHFANGEEPSARTVQLRLHARVREAAYDGSFARLVPELREHAVENGNRLDVPALLVRLDLMLLSAFGAEGEGRAVGAPELDEVAQLFEERKMLAMAALVRVVAAACALVRDDAPVDDGVFNEGAAAAARAMDAPLQLFSMTAHGWNDLLRGQVVNAQFRAQQVLRMLEGGASPLADWAGLLNTVAELRASSLVALRAEADRCDLDAEGVDGLSAWKTALVLSAVRSDAELSAWFSRHRAALLSPRLCAIMRLALAAAGDAATALRRLVPAAWVACPGQTAEAPRGELSGPAPVDELGLGQVYIRLFGGFCVEKNGHVLAAGAWRRRRSDVLAARLALCPGTFVERGVIAREMWPQSDYKHARENLYMSVSGLRRAFGQVTGGPAYLLVQGDGLGLNPEFVTTDVARFNALAREVLVHRNELPAPQVVEDCLKIEELYAGALFTPKRGVTSFFDRMRAQLRAKFLDCMVAGIDAALGEGQLPVASWLAQAALAQRPYREDVVRCALRTLRAQGRRVEARGLFEEHARMLACTTGTAPERATRELFEQIVTDAAR